MRESVCAWWTICVALGVTSAPAGEGHGPEGVTIPGQVIDHIGGGVTDMSVAIYREADGKPHGEPLAETTTDTYGDFSLELPAGSTGTFVVRMTKKGLTDIERVIEISPDEPVPFIDAQALGAVRLHGRVKRSSDDVPIEGAEITVSDGYATWKARSDQAGRFTVEHVPPKRTRLRIEADGYATVTERLPDMTGAEPVEIWMKPGWSATVEIVDPLGTPIPNVIVEALDDFKHRLLTETTDARGEATFTGLSPDARRLFLRFTHFVLPASDEFDHVFERAGEKTEVRERFEVELAGRIKGVVTDAKTSEPIFSARVMVGEYIGGALPKAWTDEKGEYSLASLPPGLVVVTVHHSDYAPALKELDVSSGRTEAIHFQLETGRSVAGQVFDDQGKPVPGARVSAERWRGYSTAGMKTLTDEQGKFVFERAPVDSFEVMAWKGGYEPQTLVADRKQADLHFELKMPESATGGVVGTKFRPGDTAPDVTLKTLDGREMKLAELQGKVVLLDFWATWCGPCLMEMDQLKGIHKKFGQRGDFVMIGVSLDHSEDMLRKYIEKEKLAWPQVYGGKGWASGPVGAFDVKAIPATFLIDKKGKIAGVNSHGSALTEAISKLLE